MSQTNQRSARYFLSLLLLNPLFPFAVEAQVPSRAKPLFRSTTITESGSYRLIESFSSASAIVIQADNVTLDLDGHSMTGPGNKQGIGVSIEGANNVRVHNGHLSDFGIGVRVMNSANVQLDGLQINGHDLGGTPPDIEIGVLILNSRAVVVENNAISRTFLGIFVRGGSSAGNRIAGNTLTGGNNGALAICYNPATAVGADPAPQGDLVEGNLISRFNIGIATSIATAGNVFRNNAIAYFGMAVNENTPGANIFLDNQTIQIIP
ncbi:MAG: right-handed parallel beta-helix repeat-containing protein [Acidobacteriota bacterium]